MRSPAAQSRGQPGEPGGLGDRQPDQAQPARAGLAGVGGHGRVAEGDAQVSVIGISVGVAAGCRRAGSGGRQLDQAAQGVADRDAAELGEGGQRGVPAGGVPGPHLSTGPSQARPFPF